MSERHSKVVASKLCGGAARRSVLRALADHADDDNSVSLSVPELAREAEVSDRTVQNHLKAFLKEGLISRTGEREVLRGKVAIYTLVGAAIRALPDVRPAMAAPVTMLHPRNGVTGEIAAPVNAPPKTAKQRKAAAPTPKTRGATAAPVKESLVTTYSPNLEREDILPLEVEVFAREPVRRRKRNTGEGSYIDPEWCLAGVDQAYAAERGFLNGRASALADAFKNHWLGASGQKARKRDWHAAWRFWVDNEIKWKGDPKNEQPRPQQASPNRRRARSVETEILMRDILDDSPDSHGRLDFSPAK